MFKEKLEAKIFLESGKVIRVWKDKSFEPKELQTFVNGYYKTILIPNGMVLIVNRDEKDLGINQKATKVFERYYPYDYIVGNVVYCSQNLLK